MGLMVRNTGFGREQSMIPLFVLLAALIGASTGLEQISTIHLLSATVVAGCLVLPWFSAPLALVVLGFAGRFDLPPFASGKADIAFWTALGLAIIAVAAGKRLDVRVHISDMISLSLVAFILTVLISIIPTYGYHYAEDKAFRVVFYAIAFVVLSQFVFRSVDHIQKFLIIFISFVSVLALISSILAVQQYGLLGMQRITPPGGGPITLARLLGFAVIACIGLSFFHPKKKVFLTGAMILGIVTFATGSRGPAIFLVVLALSFPVLASLNQRTRRQAIGLGGIFIGIVLLIIPMLRLAVDSGIPFVARFALLFESGKGTSVSARQDFITTGLDLAADSKYLGWGIGSWPLLTQGEDVIGYPHNIFIEILVEQGVIGLITFIVFISMVIMVALLSLRRSSSAVAAGLVSVGLVSFWYSLLIAQTSGDLYDNRYVWFYAGFILSCTSLVRNERLAKVGISNAYPTGR